MAFTASEGFFRADRISPSSLSRSKKYSLASSRVMASILRIPAAIALSLSVFLLYGGMVAGIFPDKLNISFESQLFGAFTGLLLAVLLRNTDPRPPVKKYSWEEEDDGLSTAVSDMRSKDQNAINSLHKTW